MTDEKVQPMWVLCSVREPDEEGRYLIQYQQYGQVRIFIGDYLPGDGWSCRFNDMEVIQWQQIVPPADPDCEDATAVVAARKSKSTDYLAGEKAGLEEAAKIATMHSDKNAEYVDKLKEIPHERHAARMASGAGKWIAIEIRKLIPAPPAAISDCATSDVEAAGKQEEN